MGETVAAGEQVDVQSLPLVSPTGISRCVSEGEFVFKRLATLAAAYLVLDFCSVAMSKDAGFALASTQPPQDPTYFESVPLNGPCQSFELPRPLDPIRSGLLLPYRDIVGFLSFMAVLGALFALNDLVQYPILKACAPSRSQLWLHPSSFGSLRTILNKGLGGFWGGFWHSTFRHGFLAPGFYLLRHGYLAKGTRTTTNTLLFLSFVQSGVIHSAARLTSVPAKLWRPLAFFFLQAFGIVRT
ncbi:hypothetical protein HIM_09374 [Hirsutella minnesotensis 3608]|uniref:Wax synthase domain-containing protein n=1 Tax=Hirsutella minnesotensis 3608 TaxID=1043627 RepID=A0A0F7ZGP1_9HYPO|nr:hypothetical protein HIM_09374 [Hirsutella minnesotensis 3608]